MAIFSLNRPDVRLIKSFKTPAKNIAATAKTCYSNRGIIFDEDISLPRDEDLIKELYKSGHHTTFEHAYFQFAISNVSRQTVWSLLHAHPFFNSEQVSQRYTEVNKDSFFIPDLEYPEKKIFIDVLENQYASYKKLSELLFPNVEHEYFIRFPGRRKNISRHKNDIKKKSQEIARYVLPIGTYTYLYHTISLITIIRYFFISQQDGSTYEEKYLVSRMIKEISDADKDLEIILKKIISGNKFNIFKSFRKNGNLTFGLKKKFDIELGHFSSKLIDYNKNGEKTLADSIRFVIGNLFAQMSDTEAIDLLLNPARNKILAQNVLLSNYDTLSRTLNHVKYVFKKKISHTADSQNQRHRTIPSSKPEISQQDLNEPDYITPTIIKQEPKIKKEYDSIMNILWEKINILLHKGVATKEIIYLLPNAYSIRLVESGSLLNYHHKYSQRTCYNAQEEIWQTSLDEIKQITKINPNIGKYLLPPCSIREMAGETPFCTEGKRFCGINVWRLKIEEYERVI